MWQLGHKEGWVPKNRCIRTVVLEKTLESPLDCKEIQQSVLKEISPGYSLEGLMLKLKLQYFGHLMWRSDSLEKTLMLGKIEGRKRKGRQRMRWLDGIINSMDMSLSKLGDSEGQGSLVCCSPWGRKELNMTRQLEKGMANYFSMLALRTPWICEKAKSFSYTRWISLRDLLYDIVPIDSYLYCTLKIC